MTQNGLSYAQALKLAQEKGFAEADPTNDVKGKDFNLQPVMSVIFCALSCKIFTTPLPTVPKPKIPISIVFMRAFLRV